jgi:hypothetical protein
MNENNQLLAPAQIVRLELLKFVYRHDRSPEDVIQRAEKLEEYVVGKAAGQPSSAQPATMKMGNHKHR